MSSRLLGVIVCLQDTYNDADIKEFEILSLVRLCFCARRNNEQVTSTVLSEIPSFSCNPFKKVSDFRSVL